MRTRRPAAEDRPADKLFHSRLENQIDLRQPLVQLSQRLPWDAVEQGLSPPFPATPAGGGRPALPVRLIAGLLYLKHANDLSDDDVTCLSQSSAIELKTLLGQRAGITIRHHGGKRKVNGVVTAVRQLGADGGLSSYRLPIQPALALLAYRRTCRIFQEESVPDIVAQIVQEHRASNPPIAASFRLDQQLRQRRPPEVA
ncbi:phage late control D family protein, partial [Xanthomonas oryzae]|uniref:phage late control D family protein n=1 Tax=Xanthomonas oryzae TaxID=347 RepID=UPI00227D8B72